MVAGTAGAGPLAVLDQDNLATANPGNIAPQLVVIDDGIGLAQTFTVGITGMLEGIALQAFRLENFGAPALDLRIDIVSTGANGAPGASLAHLLVPRADVPTFSVPTQATYTLFDLGAQALGVHAGDLLGIALTVPGGTMNVFHYGWAIEFGNDYTGGALWGWNGASMGIVQPTSDVGFRTFVSPLNATPVPSSGTLALGVLALGVLAASHRRVTPAA